MGDVSVECTCREDHCVNNNRAGRRYNRRLRWHDMRSTKAVGIA